jgi:O-methyltransferase involved in polyketide biosynthesis
MRNDSASATAKVIAAATIYLHTHYPQWKLTHARAATLCAQWLSGSTTDRLLAASAKSKFARPFWAALERATLPGIITHYARRKSTIEYIAREWLYAHANGGNVFVVGAGFDTLAWRLAPSFPNVSFTEIDHPATQRVKLVQGVARPENLRLSACDLSRRDNYATLFGETNTPRLVIAEGLLMYFSELHVERFLFDALHAAYPSRADVVFTYMHQHDQLPPGFRPRSVLIDWWLKRKSETFQWSADEGMLDAMFARIQAMPVAHIPAHALDPGALPAELATCGVTGENVMHIRA